MIFIRDSWVKLIPNVILKRLYTFILILFEKVLIRCV